MSDFVDFNLVRATWLRRQVGEGYLLVLGLMKQVCLEAMHEAVRLSMPDSAPTDALPWIARDRGQETGFEGETATQIRARLKQAFAIARGRGWVAGTVRELQRIGYPNARIEDQSDDPAFEWWQYRVVLERPFPFDDQHLADGTWGSPGTWSDGGTWASAMPPAHLRHVRAIVRKGRATHSRCVGIRVIYDDTNPFDRIDLDA